MGFCFNLGFEAPRNSLELEEEEPSLPSSKDENFYIPVSFTTMSSSYSYLSYFFFKDFLSLGLFITIFFF
jgi:hypothetical protein